MLIVPDIFENEVRHEMSHWEPNHMGNLNNRYTVTSMDPDDARLRRRITEFQSNPNSDDNDLCVCNRSGLGAINRLEKDDVIGFD